MKEKYSNMLESFETMGHWWLPGSENKHSGTLRYNPQESILELKVISDLLPLQSGPIPTHRNIKMVHGLTVGGQYMTLLNCLYILDSIRMPGYSSNKVYPQFVFVGCCFGNESEILFNEATYSCHNNEYFVGESGFRSELQTQDGQLSSYTLSYKYPETIGFELGDFAVSTTWRTNLPTQGPELHISEKAGFVIKTSEYLSHADFLKTPITSIHTFIELIAEERLPIRTVILYSDKLGWTEDNGSFHREPISLLWKQNISFPLPKARHRFELTLTLREMSGEIGGIMRRWHDTRLKYEPAHNLFFTVLRMRRELNLENLFLNLCHVLEVYHRIKSGVTYMNAEEYRALLDTIVASVPEGHRQHIRQRLEYGNELSLRQRLKQLYDLLPQKIQSRIGPKKMFCNLIVNTRNYLTHYDESIKSQALTTEGMMKYEYILIAICKVVLLLEAGVSPELISKRIGNFRVPEPLRFNGG
ncbi:MAG: ApeA N-terminal domain 1-containing protein [Planctomycetota bacterium]